jgi:hypothetical protein
MLAPKILIEKEIIVRDEETGKQANHFLILPRILIIEEK